MLQWTWHLLELTLLIIFDCLCTIHPQGFAEDQEYYCQGLLFLFQIYLWVLESLHVKLPISGCCVTERFRDIHASILREKHTQQVNKVHCKCFSHSAQNLRQQIDHNAWFLKEWILWLLWQVLPADAVWNTFSNRGECFFLSYKILVQTNTGLSENKFSPCYIVWSLETGDIERVMKGLACEL